MTNQLTKREIALMKLYDMVKHAVEYAGKLRLDTALISSHQMFDFVLSSGLSYDDLRATVQLVGLNISLPGQETLELSIDIREELESAVISLGFEKDNVEDVILRRVDHYLFKREKSKALPSLEECARYVKTDAMAICAEEYGKEEAIENWFNSQKNTLIFSGYYNARASMIV